MMMNGCVIPSLRIQRNRSIPLPSGRRRSETTMSPSAACCRSFLAVERWKACTVRNPSRASRLQTNSQYTMLSSTTMIFILSIVVFLPFFFCQPDYLRTLIQHSSYGIAYCFVVRCAIVMNQFIKFPQRSVGTEYLPRAAQVVC